MGLRPDPPILQGFPAAVISMPAEPSRAKAAAHRKFLYDMRSFFLAFPEISMKALLSFDTLIIPKIVTIFYYLALLVVLLGGLSAIFTHSILAGLGIILFGALGVRVYFELLIVFFKIHETLGEIRDTLQEKQK